MALTKLNYTGQGTIPIAKIPTITSAKMPSDSVLQVINKVISSQPNTSGSANTFADIPNFSQAITPTLTSNKIIIDISLNNVGMAGGNSVRFKLLRGSTTIGASSVGLANSIGAFAIVGGRNYGTTNRQRDSISVCIEDSPSSTSAVTYKVQWTVDGSTGYLNRWATSTDLGIVSNIKLTEIKG